MFKAGGENVTGMPEDNYLYDDVVGLYDFYFAGDTFTLPTTEPTREGYSFEGWSVKVIPAENDAVCCDADGADNAANETLLKAGDTYIITAGGVVFTAQWKLNTYTVTFDPNADDATVSPTSKKVTFDAPYGDLPTCTVYYVRRSNGGGVTVIESPNKVKPKAAELALNTDDHFAYVNGYPDGTVKPTNNAAGRICRRKQQSYKIGFNGHTTLRARPIARNV